MSFAACVVRWAWQEPIGSPLHALSYNILEGEKPCISILMPFILISCLFTVYKRQIVFKYCTCFFYHFSRRLASAPLEIIRDTELPECNSVAMPTGKCRTMPNSNLASCSGLAQLYSQRFEQLSAFCHVLQYFLCSSCKSFDMFVQLRGELSPKMSGGHFRSMACPSPG